MELFNFKSAIELLDYFSTEQKCIDHLTMLRWNGTVLSPFDHMSKVYKCGKNRWYCKNTNKYFNVKTDTFFDNTKLPLRKWLLAQWYITSHKKGISSHQLAKDVGVTQKTAWFMMHRLREALDHPDFQAPLEGIIEGDEMFYGGLNINKHEHKKVKYSRGGGNDKLPIVGLLQRGGHLVVKSMEVVNMQTMSLFVQSKVIAESKFMTDTANHYLGANRIYDHQTVNHFKKEWVRGEVHTNGIEGFWSLLKRGIQGIYHWVSREHIDRYLIEFAFRYNTRTFAESKRFNYALSNMNDTKLRYKKLISNGKRKADQKTKEGRN